MPTESGEEWVVYWRLLPTPTAHLLSAGNQAWPLSQPVEVTGLPQQGQQVAGLLNWSRREPLVSPGCALL